MTPAHIFLVVPRLFTSSARRPLLLSALIGLTWIGAEEAPPKTVAGLLATAVQHGFPDVRGAVSYDGDVTVVEAVPLDEPQAEPHRPNLSSPTYTGWSYGMREGQRFRGLFYHGIARHLHDGRWLLGDCELVTPTATIQVDASRAVALPGYACATITNDNNTLSQLETMYRHIRVQTGAESQRIDALFAAASAERFDGELLVSPWPLVHAIQAGYPLPDYALPLVDVEQRLIGLGTLHGRYQPLRIDVRDGMSSGPDEANPSQQGETENEDTGALIAADMAAGRLTWPTAHSPEGIVRHLLATWFTGLNGLSSAQADAAIQALGETVTAEDSATEPAALPPSETETQAAGTDVSSRLRRWVPQALHADPDHAESARLAAQNGQPADGTAAGPLFTYADIPELIAHLDNQQASVWNDGDARRSVGDCALRGIGEVLGFDPRLLVGEPVGARWTPQRQSATAMALRAWWNRVRDQECPVAVALAAVDLSPAASVRLFLRLPADWRSVVLERLLPRWSVSPPDLEVMPPRQVAELLAVLVTYPQARSMVATWRCERQPALLLALWQAKVGNHGPLDQLLRRAVDDPMHGPIAADPYLIRKLMAVASAMPTPTRVALLAEVVRRPITDRAMHDVLMAALFRSSWTDGLDAFLPGAVVDVGGARWRYGDPTQLSWQVWPIAMADERPLPDAIRTAITLDADGHVTVKHTGAEISTDLMLQLSLDDPPAQPAGTTLADDLRICDLAAWALMRQERSHLFPDDSATCPSVDLTMARDQRSEAVAAMHRAVARQAIAHTMAPLAPPVVMPSDNDGSL